jgi:hypothetical protein
MDNQTQQAVFRELGSMDARIGNIESDMQELKTDMRDVKTAVVAVPALTQSLATLQASVQTLVERNHQDTGARRMLWKVGGAAGTGGALLTAIGQWVTDLLQRGSP